MLDLAPPSSRAIHLLLALVLTLPLLAACKDVQPGSGVQTIRDSRAQTSVSGR